MISCSEFPNNWIKEILNMKNYEPIPEHLIIRQFEDFLYSSEIPPIKPIDIVLDKKVRYQTEGDKGSETSAVYCVHSDGYPAGYILSFRHSLIINWKFDIEALKQEKEYDALYKRVKTEEYRKQAEQIRLNNEQRDKQERINAAAKAKRIYDNASELTGNHAYLQRKQVRRHEGVKELDGNLLIPLRNIKGEFMSYQTIPVEKGAKKLFCHDAPASEAFYSMGLDELEPRAPILLCEGYATGASLRELADYCYKPVAVICAMSCHNLKKIAPILRKYYPNNKIIVMADDDAKTAGNPGLSAANQAYQYANLDGIFSPPFNSPDDGTDWNDYAVKYGYKRAKEVIDHHIRWVYKTPEEREREARIAKIEALDPIINAADLVDMEFPDIKWAIPGLVPTGLALLCGNPKAGKSMMVLHMALAIAYGGYAFGNIKCEQGRVLYLALEDDRRRLKSRIRNSFGIDIKNKQALSKFDIKLSIPREHKGGLEYLDNYLSLNPDTRLVIIDTFQKFRKQLSSKGNIYSEDYEAAADIKRLADKYQVAILVIHHLRKMQDNNDPFNEISGTNGIAGAADTSLIWKRERRANYGTLEITGRDVEEKKYRITCENFDWFLSGEVEDEGEPEAAARPLSQSKLDIINYLTENPGQTPKDIADALGIDNDKLRVKLSRMLDKGEIRKTGALYYAQDEE